MKFFFSGLIFLCLFFSGTIKASKIKIATLEWAPYTCENCPGGGITTKILRDYFKSHGIVAEFTFFPWARAAKVVEKGEFDTLWPCWPDEVKSLKLVESDVIFTSPISFVGYADKIEKIKKMDDLLQYRLGSVFGYGYNTDMRRILKETKKGNQEVVSDQMNIEKLVAGRVDYIAIDLINMRYILHSKMPKEKNNLVAVPFINYELPLIFGIHKKDQQRFHKLFGDKNFKNSMNKKIEEELKTIFLTPPKNSEHEKSIFKNYLSSRNNFLTGESGTGQFVE